MWPSKSEVGCKKPHFARTDCGDCHKTAIRGPTLSSALHVVSFPSAYYGILALALRLSPVNYGPTDNEIIKIYARFFPSQERLWDEANVSQTRDSWNVCLCVEVCLCVCEVMMCEDVSVIRLK